MDLESLEPERVEAVFARHGALSVTLTDAGDRPVLEPAPGMTPLWSETRISALFSAAADLDALAADLSATLGRRRLPAYRVETLADRSWEREWLKDFGPMQFGERLWVCPGETAAPDGAIVVRLDPGLAFGTGTHPTTALCLEWLERRPLANATILDYGCGSGVLAIAALKLGCRAAVAVDIDPQAITAARANAARNGVAGRIDVRLDNVTLEGRFDFVVANILAGPLMQLAPSIAARLRAGGELALSGILSDQAEEVRAAYSPWIRFEPTALRSRNDQAWAIVSGRRRDS